MQQEFMNTKLLCLIHPECKQIILFFGEESEKKSRIQCIQCILDSFTNNKVNLNQFIYLQDFILDPITSLIKILHVNSIEGRQNIQQPLYEIENLVISFEQALKGQIIKIKENIQQMRIIVQQIAEEASNELELNEILNQIQQLDSFQNLEELNNLQNSLAFVSKTLDQAYINARDRINNLKIQLIIYNGYEIAKNFMFKQLNLFKISILEIIRDQMESLLYKSKEQLELWYNRDFQIY